MRQYVVYVIVMVLALGTATYLLRPTPVRPIPARELLADLDYFHGRSVTVDTLKGWEVGDGRTLLFPGDISKPPLIVAHVPPGAPNHPPTVRGVFMRGDATRPHVILLAP